MSYLWVHPEELDEGSGSPHAYEACKTASLILYALSGRKYKGIRRVTETYECPCRSVGIAPWRVFAGTTGDGQIYNSYSSAVSGSGCGCSGVVGGQHVRLRLRGTPVRSVHKVVLSNGVELESSQYKVVNGSLLQLTGAPGDVCGITVTYTYGVNIPAAGRQAARYLATELVKGWNGDSCDLPSRTTSVTREGISLTLLDQQDFLDDLRTGVYAIDLFLKAVNPDKARKPAKVFSPDAPKAHKVTSSSTSQILGPFDWSITPGEAATWSVSLSESGLDLLNDSDWEPQAQISAWNGATLLEFDPSQFNITGDTLTITLSSTDTAELSGAQMAWDVYAVNKTNGVSVLHLLTSQIFISDQVH